MIILHYDPDHGVAMPDGAVSAFVAKVVSSTASSERVEVHTCHELVVLRFRYYVHAGHLNEHNFQIWFLGEQVLFDSHGNIESWPPGFCTYFEAFIGMLH